MRIPITVESTSANSANVMIRNYNAGGLKFLSLRVPIEWNTPESKSRLVAIAREQLELYIKRNIAEHK